MAEKSSECRIFFLCAGLAMLCSLDAVAVIPDNVAKVAMKVSPSDAVSSIVQNGTTTLPRELDKEESLDEANDDQEDPKYLLDEADEKGFTARQIPCRKACHKHCEPLPTGDVACRTICHRRCRTICHRRCVVADEDKSNVTDAPNTTDVSASTDASACLGTTMNSDTIDDEQSNATVSSTTVELSSTSASLEATQRPTTTKSPKLVSSNTTEGADNTDAGNVTTDSADKKGADSADNKDTNSAENEGTDSGEEPSETDATTQKPKKKKVAAERPVSGLAEVPGQLSIVPVAVPMVHPVLGPYSPYDLIGFNPFRYRPYRHRRPFPFRFFDESDDEGKLSSAGDQGKKGIVGDEGKKETVGEEGKGGGVSDQGKNGSVGERKKGSVGDRGKDANLFMFSK